MDGPNCCGRHGKRRFSEAGCGGSVKAAREYGVEIILVGDESKIKPVLDSQNPGRLPIRIVHAPEMLTMEDKGEALTFKARHGQSSMAVGMDLVKKGEADAFVTAGNTGAGIVTALFRLGALRRDRPALVPIFPTATGSCVVLDIGVNPDCTPENLIQFAIMGSIYAENSCGAVAAQAPRTATGTSRPAEEASARTRSRNHRRAGARRCDRGRRGELGCARS